MSDLQLVSHDSSGIHFHKNPFAQIPVDQTQNILNTQICLSVNQTVAQNSRPNCDIRIRVDPHVK